MLPLAPLRIANKIAIKSTMANGVRCCLDEERGIFFFLTVIVAVVTVVFVTIVCYKLLTGKEFLEAQ